MTSDPKPTQHGVNEVSGILEEDRCDEVGKTVRVFAIAINDCPIEIRLNRWMFRTAISLAAWPIAIPHVHIKTGCIDIDIGIKTNRARPSGSVCIDYRFSTRHPYIDKPGSSRELNAVWVNRILIVIHEFAELSSALIYHDYQKIDKTRCTNTLFIHSWDLALSRYWYMHFLTLDTEKYLMLYSLFPGPVLYTTTHSPMQHFDTINPSAVPNIQYSIQLTDWLIFFKRKKTKMSNFRSSMIHCL